MNVAVCCRVEEYGPCFKLYVLHKCLIVMSSDMLLKVRMWMWQAGVS